MANINALRKSLRKSNTAYKGRNLFRKTQSKLSDAQEKQTQTKLQYANGLRNNQPTITQPKALNTQKVTRPQSVSATFSKPGVSSRTLGSERERIESQLKGTIEQAISELQAEVKRRQSGDVDMSNINGRKPVNTPEVQQAEAPESPADFFTTQINNVQGEITDLERKQALLGQRETEEFVDSGLAQDQQDIEQQKLRIQELKDQQTLLPFNEMQRYRDAGVVGTKDDVKRATSQDIQDATLSQLAETRNMQARATAYNANVALLNAKYENQNKILEFNIKQKNKTLDAIVKQQGSYLTAKENAAIEMRKQQNAIDLENMKFNNSIKKDFLTEMAERGASGADLARYSTMTFEQLKTEQFKSQNVTSDWLNMTQEQAMMKLDSDQYERSQEYNNLDPESKEQEIARQANIDASNNMISTIDSLLNNEDGLSSAVGPTGLQRLGFMNPQNVQKFRADMQGLVSTMTLDTLKNLKQSGATLGAISEKELAILQNANTRLGLIYDKNGMMTGESSLSESAFKSRLKEIQQASLKVNLLNELGNAEFKARGLNNPNVSYDTMKIIHDDIQNGTMPTTQARGGLQDAMERIAAVESRGSGGYKARGPKVSRGQYAGERAMGRYQVMPGNLAGVNGSNWGWDLEILGRPVTETEFMSNPQIQDAIAGGKLAQYKSRYGTWEDAASVWFSGRPLSPNNRGRDALGTSPQQYVQKFTNAIV